MIRDRYHFIIVDHYMCGVFYKKFQINYLYFKMNQLNQVRNYCGL